MNPLLLLTGPAGWAIAIGAVGISICALADQAEQVQRDANEARQKEREASLHSDKVRLKLQQGYTEHENQLRAIKSALQESRLEKTYWKEKKTHFTTACQNLYNERQRLYRKKKGASKSEFKQLRSKIQVINASLSMCRETLKSTEKLFSLSVARYRKYQRKHRTTQKAADQIADLILQLS